MERSRFTETEVISILYGADSSIAVKDLRRKRGVGDVRSGGKRSRTLNVNVDVRD